MGDADPYWDDPARVLGQMFMMGFDGTNLTPAIRSLIQDHHLGAVLLTAKNLTSVESATRLILELQTCAYQAGHPYPLAIAIDQENGGLNSLVDDDHIQSFPGAMGLAAAGSFDLMYQVARATAEQVSACGINWILGPCLDVSTNRQNQPLGTRTAGNDPGKVSAYGKASIKGIRDAGVATMGKHFPSYGNLEFLGSSQAPTITTDLEQLSTGGLIPFKDAINAGIDAIMVGGCAMVTTELDVTHACLSEQVVSGILRARLGFDRVVVSDCLEMEALNEKVGIGNGTVMAARAGCDIILLCSSYTSQLEALSGLSIALKNDDISDQSIRRSLDRILRLKDGCTSWVKALNTSGLSSLFKLGPSHANVSIHAYNSSITIVRDTNNILPMKECAEEGDELLLLTPLVRPNVATIHVPTNPIEIGSDGQGDLSTMTGEQVFRQFGRDLARRRIGRVLHSSYTENGVSQRHESLVARASQVIIFTADAGYNMYQRAFTKHVSMLCEPRFTDRNKPKSLIVVAVSSPYDFIDDATIATYVCTYDFTEAALSALIKVSFGDVTSNACLPNSNGTTKTVAKSRQHWLVEQFDEIRDMAALDDLLAQTLHTSHTDDAGGLDDREVLKGRDLLFHHDEMEMAHLVVRNSSTQTLYGFCSTYFSKVAGTGVIGALFVRPGWRKRSIGYYMHQRAVRTLAQKHGALRMRLGSRILGIYPGVPLKGQLGIPVRPWFNDLGWNTAGSHTVGVLVLENLQRWETAAAPQGDFILVRGSQWSTTVLEHVKVCGRSSLYELYSFALDDASTCGVLCLFDAQRLVGTIIIYRTQSRLANIHHALPGHLPCSGGLSSPVVRANVPTPLAVRDALVVLGTKQMKTWGENLCILDHHPNRVPGSSDYLSELGYQVAATYEEISSDSDVWR